MICIILGAGCRCLAVFLFQRPSEILPEGITDLTSFVCLGGKKSSNAFFFFFFKLHASPKKLLNTEKSTLSSTSNSVTPAHPAEMNPQRKV